MDLDDLLETVEADEDEAVVQLGGRGLLRRHLVQEEPVEGEWLLVDHVLHAAVLRVVPERGRRPRGVAPVFRQGRLLKDGMRALLGSNVARVLQITILARLLEQKGGCAKSQKGNFFLKAEE